MEMPYNTLKGVKTVADRVSDLMEEYERMFGSRIPLMNFMGCTDDKLVEIIETCLGEGKEVIELYPEFFQKDVLY
jgi:hypothetical protein